MIFFVSLTDQRPVGSDFPLPHNIRLIYSSKNFSKIFVFKIFRKLVSGFSESKNFLVRYYAFRPIYSKHPPITPRSKRYLSLFRFIYGPCFTSIQCYDLNVSSPPLVGFTLLYTIQYYLSLVSATNKYFSFCFVYFHIYIRFSLSSSLFIFAMSSAILSICILLPFIRIATSISFLT